MLTREFFARPTLEVAPELVGAILHVAAGGEECSGRIVEVEAYLGEEDPASHAGRGRTPRSSIMFGPAGVAYVYLIYGMYHCLNFVTEEEGTAGAVLIRAVEPLSGRETMARRRGLERSLVSGRVRPRDLTAGPGKLCAACGVDLGWNGLPLTDDKRRVGTPGAIWVQAAPDGPGRVEATARIGIRRAVESPYRFVDPASSCLSR